MSGSPQYTTVFLGQRRHAELEAARLRREQARRRRQEQARAGRLRARGAEAAECHPQQARDRGALLCRLADESAEVDTRVTTVLEDAAAAGVLLPGAHRVRQDLVALREEADGRDVTRWERRITDLRSTADDLVATVDSRLDELERMSIVVRAARQALPRAGLRVVPSSLTEYADAVSFRAERADGTPIDLTAYVGDGRGVRLEYRADGVDPTSEERSDGNVARGDATEELLYRFHEELAGQGVRADGLHSLGEPPQPRRPLTAAPGAAGSER